MRYGAVLLALLVALPLAGASTGAAVGATAASATLSGTVTTESGTPASGAYVLVQNASDSTFAGMTDDRAVHETFLKLSRADMEGVRAVRADGRGRYEISLPPGEYDLVAVTEERLSGPVRNVTVEGETTRNLAVEPDAVVTVEGGDATVAPGDETTVTVRVHNPDDDPARNVSVSFAPPAGLAVTPGVAKGSPSVDADAGRVTWSSVAANDAVSFALTVRVPENASQETYRITFDGRSATHFVETVDETRLARPAGETTTAVPAGGDGSERTATTDTATPNPETTVDGQGPGFGVLVGVLALLAAGGLFHRRPRS